MKEVINGDKRRGGREKGGGSEIWHFRGDAIFEWPLMVEMVSF